MHKVTIIGRGNGMGGFTMYRPEEDRFLHTVDWLMHCLAGLLGGTAAEELALNSISDGATSDLQRATSIARKMVVDFGMSPALGRVCYGADPSGQAVASWSEQTAREIDLEVRRLLDEALALAHAVLRRRAVLQELPRAGREQRPRELRRARHPAVPEVPLVRAGQAAHLVVDEDAED